MVPCGIFIAICVLAEGQVKVIPRTGADGVYPNPPSLVIDQISQQTVTSKSGSPFVMTAALSEAPDVSDTITVRITVSDLSEAQAIPTHIVFTSGNWAQPASLSIVGLADAHNGDKVYDVALSCTSNLGEASKYNGVSYSVPLTNTDNAIIDLSLTTERITTYEAGGSSSAGVFLRSPPLSNVSVTASGINPLEGRLSGAPAIVFTPSNYAIPQYLTISGVDDAAMDGDQTYVVILTCASADPNWNGLSRSIAVVNVDNDGFSFFRFTPTRVRGLPSKTWNQVSISELRFKDANMNEIALSGTGATAECHTPDGLLCPGGGGADAAIDGLPTQWTGTLGSSIDISFTRPVSVCSHSYITSGAGSEASDPTMWQLAVKHDITSEWLVIYNSTTPLDTSGLARNAATPWFAICPIKVISVGTNSPVTSAPGTPLSLATSAPELPIPDAPTMVDLTPSNPSAAADPPAESSNEMWVIVTIGIAVSIFISGLALLWYKSKEGSKEVLKQHVIEGTQGVFTVDCELLVPIDDSYDEAMTGSSPPEDLSFETMSHGHRSQGLREDSRYSLRRSLRQSLRQTPPLTPSMVPFEGTAVPLPSSHRGTSIYRGSLQRYAI
eukprot:TRINITY_DN342_c1_g1_i1.p1 TRINITY_DN342_c1_g1~~TRINITY_DN342_c1_g1_i1.p1  ORF type:complete len:611 (+),score=61.21 TRINITY_DN342_c1_g1_i1:52-1884(+)